MLAKEKRPQIFPRRILVAPFSAVYLYPRGLGSVYLVTSNTHLGIQAAIGQVLPTASWQRLPPTLC
nr:transposase [Corynebacterium segmentosum]